ncbi:MAG: hypothetical protein WA899_18185, partial [Candidatus Sulfotelmatobacter sp.]
GFLAKQQFLRPLIVTRLSGRAGRGKPHGVQLDCHPERSVLCVARDPGEPREASRSLRRNTRAFGSPPYYDNAATLPNNPTE